MLLVLLIAALGLAAWRRPGLVGALFRAFAPVGAFVTLLGSTNLDPTSYVIFGLAFLAGLALVAGILLVAAARARR